MRSHSACFLSRISRIFFGVFFILTSSSAKLVWGLSGSWRNGMPPAGRSPARFWPARTASCPNSQRGASPKARHYFQAPLPVHALRIGTIRAPTLALAHCRLLVLVVVLVLVDRKSTRLNSSHLGISYAVF